ncbi:MAG: SAM-dependent methyltransferase [Pirellulales bacterium]
MGPSQAADRHRRAFLFATCQVGAESTLKAEFARDWPALSFAYSRSGFLTFKLPDDHRLPDDFDPKSVFARAYGFSLGKAAGESLDEAAAEVWKIAGRRPYEALHVWQRDTAAIGQRGFEPHVTPAALATEEAIRRHERAETMTPPLARVAQAGQLVLDCILVEPHEWWVGYHRAAGDDSRFPGGLRDMIVPADAVSRAYVKMEEALGWSGLPIREGQKIAEIGCSPGGASQALLNRGLRVVGIDPARVDPRVLADPNFTHIQKRGADVRRREFRGVTWLAADMNVAPDYTLETVEAIVTHPAVNIRGLLLTLKLLEWNLAEHVPQYLDRVRSWGYSQVAARQLPHNRREICVAAVRRKRKRP